MARHWEDREKIRTNIGSMGLMAHVCWFLGIAFAVLGVISVAVKIPLGLGSISWLLLAIAAFMAGMFPSIGWSVAVYLGAIEAKSKKEG